MRHTGLLSACAVLLMACSGEASSDTTTADTSVDPASGPGTLVLSFDLDPDLIATMDEPAQGVFQGSVFAEADASALGPADGATPLLDFESPALDFGTDGGLLGDTVTVGPIDAQIAWILGCLDTDGNGCEKGDPITIPNENKVQVTPGEADYTVKMTLLNPS